MSAHYRFGSEAARDDYVAIRGWDKEEVRSLLECVAKVAHLVEDALEYAQDSIEFAERHMRKHGGADPNKLTLQHVAAFNLYTKENLANPEQSFFRVMNAAFNSDNRKQVLPFFDYLHLFVDGAKQLPNACPAKLWRAFPNQDPRWPQLYPIGKEKIWWAFSSTTKNSEVLSDPSFFGTDTPAGQGGRTLFMLDCVSGIDISAFSDFPEAEVLLMPGSAFVVEQTMAPTLLGGVLQVVMRQTPSRHDLLPASGGGGGGAAAAALGSPPAAASPKPTGALANAGMSDEAALQAAMAASMAKKTSQPQTAQVNSSFRACNALSPPLSSSLRLCCLIFTPSHKSFHSRTLFDLLLTSALMYVCSHMQAQAAAKTIAELTTAVGTLSRWFYEICTYIDRMTTCN